MQSNNHFSNASSETQNTGYAIPQYPLFYTKVGNETCVLRLISKNNSIEQYQIIQRIQHNNNQMTQPSSSYATTSTQYNTFQDQTFPAHQPNQQAYNWVQPAQANNTLVPYQNDCLLNQGSSNPNAVQYQQYYPQNAFVNPPANTVSYVRSQYSQQQYAYQQPIQQYDRQYPNNLPPHHNQQPEYSNQIVPQDQQHQQQYANLNQQQYEQKIHQQQLLQNFLDGYYKKNIATIKEQVSLEQQQQQANIRRYQQLQQHMLQHKHIQQDKFMQQQSKQLQQAKQQNNQNHQQQQQGLSAYSNTSTSSSDINDLISMIFKLEYTETEVIKCEGCEKSYVGKFRWIMHVKTDHSNIQNAVVKIHLYKMEQKKRELNAIKLKGIKTRHAEAERLISAKSNAEKLQKESKVKLKIQ